MSIYLIGRWKNRWMLGFEDWEFEIGDGDSTVIAMRIDKGIELGEIFFLP